jgi:hypothetical protein
MGFKKHAPTEHPNIHEKSVGETMGQMNGLAMKIFFYFSIQKGRPIMGMVKHSFETMRKPSAEDWARVEAIPDEAIDFSDIPEVKDFSGFSPVQENL